MNKKFLNEIFQRHKNCPSYPSLNQVNEFVDQLLGLLFPLRNDIPVKSPEDVEHRFESVKTILRDLERATCSGEVNSGVADSFIDALPSLYRLILTDIDAMYNGDPAASCKEEVIRSYPGFYAIACYRIAHFLYEEEMEIIPRTITELAHQKTGIDIHPGAKIQSHFCIDHGTGVVIGETTVIGKNVKIYQGVTLGALSVKKEDASTKRHPTIEDNVIIYAGATILGGSTIVGRNSIIGGNVWLPRSVPPDSKIYYKAQMHHSDSSIDTFIFNQGDQQTK